MRRVLLRAQIRDPNDLEVRALTELEAPLVDEIKTAGNHFFAKQQYRFYSQPHAPPSTKTISQMLSKYRF